MCSPRLRCASVHPGWVETEGIRNAQAMAGFYSLMSRTLRTGAAASAVVPVLPQGVAQASVPQGGAAQAALPGLAQLVPATPQAASTARRPLAKLGAAPARLLSKGGAGRQVFLPYF